MDTFYWAKRVALAGTGLFAGIGLTVSYVGVPTVKATSDPLPSFLVLYTRGSHIAITTILVSTFAGLLEYYETHQPKYLYGALLSFVSAPITAIFIMPLNKRLSNLSREKGDTYDRALVQGLVDKWASLQRLRAIAGALAFIVQLM
ncbi:hypothetical protein BZG36_00670 [Bifiguratus adelaidae]|uniref:DUF1772 domain-containing protein n=1 Tax=Bifiguratus adelaidae TaxID=1938954 RepID=A0A261Y6V7_9FUNG|nr:hypothetical protein BZG36_00670 [Bifiguratus adelaidae]